MDAIKRWSARSATTCLLLLAAALPVQAAGTVEVSYTQPEKFADIGRNIIDRERTLKAFTTYLQSLGAELPDGQTLRLEVTDINLAGEIWPWGRGASEVRIMRGRADWPQMTLRYTLLAEGRTLKAGEERLADMSYLDFTPTGIARGAELAYEKRMLHRWFANNFLAH